MTKLDAGLMTSLPASDSGSTAAWISKRINPRPQSCLCLTCSGCPSNDDDDDEVYLGKSHYLFSLNNISYKLFFAVQLDSIAFFRFKSSSPFSLLILVSHIFLFSFWLLHALFTLYNCYRKRLFN